MEDAVLSAPVVGQIHLTAAGIHHRTDHGVRLLHVERQSRKRGNPGIRSNSSLARQAGLQVSQGVVVDNLLRSSHPDVFAVGDVAEHRGVTYGLWGPAQFQGTIAGMNAAGGQVEFAGIPRSNSLKVLGIDMYSIGQVSPEDGSYLQAEEESGGIYRSFLFRDNRLVGAILLGDTAVSAAAKKAIENRVDCSALLHGQPGAGDVLDFLGSLA